MVFDKKKNTVQNFVSFFPGVLDLIIIATKDSTIGEKIKALTWKVQSEGVRSYSSYTITVLYLWLTVVSSVAYWFVHKAP